VNVSAARVLAFRVARHNLRERLPAGSAAAAAVVGLQDTPPHAAGQALPPRLEEASVADFAALAIVQSMRGAPFAVAPEDVPVFTTALDPPDEAAAKAVILNAAKVQPDIPALEQLDRVSAAVADALAGGPLERDAFHQALRERLPSELLWWCKNCGSHHVHPSLWRATGVRGVLAIVGREPRGAAIFGLPPEVPAMADPGAELARRFLAAYGPSTPALFTKWTGLSGAHARALWGRAGELEPVEVEGRQAWALPGDGEAIASAPAASGVRLLTGYDPLLAGRDRELLLADEAQRKQVWQVLANPGVVLADGAIAGTWRAARKAARLVVTVTPFGDAAGRGRGAARLDHDALAAEADLVARWRGADRAELA
jgi:hypothetical protein